MNRTKTPRKQRQEARWKPGPDAVKRQNRLLEELAKGASIDAATAAAGVSRSTFYKWCQRDAGFKVQSDRLRNRTQTKAEPISFGAGFRSSISTVRPRTTRGKWTSSSTLWARASGG
jgi:hypothetical protein